MKTDEYRKGYEDGLKEMSYTHVDSTTSEEKKDLYHKQLLERGFDDTELWNLDYTIAQFVLPRLKRFREVNKGYPALLKTEDSWDEKLDEMIAYFQAYVDNNDEALEEHKEGITLFAEWFNHLWW